MPGRGPRRVKSHGYGPRELLIFNALVSRARSLGGLWMSLSAPLLVHTHCWQLADCARLSSVDSDETTRFAAGAQGSGEIGSRSL